jgi:hypothetical protein
VEQSTKPGELVLDPFAGSGVVGLAAQLAGRHFWLNDLDDSYLLQELRPAAVSTTSVVEPPYTSPDDFVAALVEAVARPKHRSSALVHDLEIFELVGARSQAVLEKLAGLRQLERATLVRRHIRALPWAKAARAFLQKGGPKSDIVQVWVHWLDL